jgi:hypothetical protein
METVGFGVVVRLLTGVYGLGAGIWLILVV